MRLRDHQERRSRLIAEMRSLNDQAAGDGGDLSDEQATKFEDLRSQLEQTERALERQRLVDEADRRAQGEPIGGSGDRQYDEARRNFSLVRAIAGQSGIAVDDGAEREIMQEMRRRSDRPFRGIPVPAEVFDKRIEQRVLTTAGDASDLVSTDHLGGQFIDTLRAAVVVRRLGARVLRGLSGNVDIPRLTTTGTSGWVAENSALTPADHVFDNVPLTPKHAGALTELSRNTLQQTSPDIEQLVRQDFAAILARALDSVALIGGGSNEPTGIVSNTNVDSSTMATPTWAELQDLIGVVEDADGAANAFVASPASARVLRTTLKVSSDAGAGFLATRSTIDDVPMAKTTLLVNKSGSPETGRLVYGNFADLLIGFWSELDVLVNPYESTAYSKGNVQIRAMMTADVALRHPESFAYADDIPL